MALAASSIDVIGFIACHLDAIAIVRLIECGNASLSTKIGHSCKNLELRSFPFMKFPFSLFNFPSLNSLTLLPHENVDIYPLRLNGLLPLPPSSIKSMGKLSLHFSQCFSLLRLENGVPLLDTYFPNLKYLKLAMSTVILSDEHMEAVPGGLEDLYLSSIETDDPAYEMRASSLYKLPPALQTLFISSGPISADIETEDYSKINWPVSLLRLTLRYVGVSMVLHLAPNLQYLELVIIPEIGKKLYSPVPTSAFPTSLTSLEITDTTRRLVTFAPTTFPPALTHCNLSFDTSTSSFDPGWDNLPKSLTYCSINLIFAQSVGIIARLPNLRHLPSHFRFMRIPDSFLACLPPKLVQLRQNNVELSSIPHMPSTITNLKIKICPAPQPSSDDPCQVESSENLGGVSRLPQFLTHLDLMNASQRVKFCKADFDLLPTTLRRLSFELHDIEDIETLRALPGSLMELEMIISPRASKNLSCDVQLFNALPMGLHKVQLHVKVAETAWEQWMLDLHRFPSINALDVYFARMDPEPEPFSLSFIPSLPNTITDLQLPLHRTVLTPELMSSLPNRLVSLSLQSNADSSRATDSSRANDECFANLPKTMTELNLPREVKGLTPNVLSLIPTSIVSLDMPAYISEHFSTFYRREADWNGYSQ